MNVNKLFLRKTVVITGAMGGYGSELVKSFADQGAALILTDRNSNYTNTHQLDASQYQYFQADLCNIDEIQNLTAMILKDVTPDVWVNNAGVFPFVDIMDVDLTQFDQLLSVNLRAPFYFCQKIGAAMSKNGGGSICNISSGAANVMRTNGSIYGATKSGLDHLTRLFAVKLGPSGVRVNGVRPGLRMGDTIQEIPPLHVEAIEKAIPLRRIAKPGELAKAVSFLCSPEASFITGEILAVDGGSSINRRRET